RAPRVVSTRGSAARPAAGSGSESVGTGSRESFTGEEVPTPGRTSRLSKRIQTATIKDTNRDSGFKATASSRRRISDAAVRAISTAGSCLDDDDRRDVLPRGIDSASRDDYGGTRRFSGFFNDGQSRGPGVGRATRAVPQPTPGWRGISVSDDRCALRESA